MYEIDPTVKAALDELPAEDRAKGAAALALGAVAIFGIAFLAKGLGPTLARLAAQMPPAGAALHKVGAAALLVALAMASAQEPHR